MHRSLSTRLVEVWNSDTVTDLKRYILGRLCPQPDDFALLVVRGPLDDFIPSALHQGNSEPLFSEQVEIHLDSDLEHLITLVSQEAERSELTPALLSFGRQRSFQDAGFVVTRASGKVDAIIILGSPRAQVYTAASSSAAEKLVAECLPLLQPSIEEDFASNRLQELSLDHWARFIEDGTEFRGAKLIAESFSHHHVQAVGEDGSRMFFKAVDSNDNYESESMALILDEPDAPRNPYIYQIEVRAARVVVVMALWQSLPETNVSFDQVVPLLKFLGFLHANLIAHTAIMRKHVVCEPSTSNCALIDYNDGVVFDSEDTTFLVDYAAEFTDPEVPIPPEALANGKSDAFRTDVWQMGRLLLHLVDHNDLLEPIKDLAEWMSSNNPEDRPDMVAVLSRLESLAEPA